MEQLRMEQAKQLLSTTSMTIREITSGRDTLRRIPSAGRSRE
ncbi:MAG: hypothetical protein ACLR6I_00660 [Waltera sp.]